MLCAAFFVCCNLGEMMMMAFVSLFPFAMSGLHGSSGMQEAAIFASDDSHVESGTAKELAELKSMLRRQDAEVERLSTQLAATEIEKRKDTEIPDLNLAGIEEF